MVFPGMETGSQADVVEDNSTVVTHVIPWTTVFLTHKQVGRVIGGLDITGSKQPSDTSTCTQVEQESKHKPASRVPQSHVPRDVFEVSVLCEQLGDLQRVKLLDEHSARTEATGGGLSLRLGERLFLVHHGS